MRSKLAREKSCHDNYFNLTLKQISAFFCTALWFLCGGTNVSCVYFIYIFSWHKENFFTEIFLEEDEMKTLNFRCLKKSLCFIYFVFFFSSLNAARWNITSLTRNRVKFIHRCLKENFPNFQKIKRFAKIKVEFPF